LLSWALTCLNCSASGTIQDTDSVTDDIVALGLDMLELLFIRHHPRYRFCDRRHCCPWPWHAWTALHRTPSKILILWPDVPLDSNCSQSSSGFAFCILLQFLVCTNKDTSNLNSSPRGKMHCLWVNINISVKNEKELLLNSLLNVFVILAYLISESKNFSLYFLFPFADGNLHA
jgi:hypothetical protein